MRVDSPRVRYTEDSIEAEYEYQTTIVAEDNDDDDNTYTVRIRVSICSIVSCVPTRRTDQSIHVGLVHLKFKQLHLIFVPF